MYLEFSKDAEYMLVLNRKPVANYSKKRVDGEYDADMRLEADKDFKTV